MIIKKISLTNFRNHTSYHLECNKDTTLILGKNGCGKTSVLEAIYILTRGKSFRSTDQEIIKHNTDFYRIEIEYSNGEKNIVTFDGKNKTFIILDKKEMYHLGTSINNAGTKTFAINKVEDKRWLELVLEEIGLSS